MKNDLFGNKYLIHTQHEISKEERQKEEAEKLGVKPKFKYTVDISLIETNCYNETVDVEATSEDEAEEKACDEITSKYPYSDDSIEIDGCMVRSCKPILTEEIIDKKTLNMFPNDNKETNNDK